MSFENDLMADIEAAGGITVAEYMARCVPQYYATQNAFGQSGDFITAPEISQMFGEMIAGWSVDLWLRAGSPAPVRLVELGPGRGTLMADFLRVAQTNPAFASAAEVHFVETSPPLREAQRQRIPMAVHHDSLASVPTGAPTIIIANEFFDALPIAQEVEVDGEWVERKVVIEDGKRWFRPEGDKVRDRRDADLPVMDEIAARLKADGGAALIIDYGHGAGEGDTLQAVRGHWRAHPLDDPGQVDLTAHVHFGALQSRAREAGLTATQIVPQANFLGALGIAARAEMLMRSADEAGKDTVRSQLNRLMAADQMGALFKVLAVTAPDWPAPAGFPPQP